jgi:hypothetical protein
MSLFWLSAKCCLASVALGKDWFVVGFFGRQQNRSLSWVFAKKILGLVKIQITFWSSKLIQIKKLWTTKFHNFWRSTTFIQVFIWQSGNNFVTKSYTSYIVSWNYTRDIKICENITTTILNQQMIK